MRNAFIVSTVLLALVGFVFPLAWIGAVVTALFAIFSAPPGLRPDGERRTGGLFGGIIDKSAIKRKMTDCPYCKKKVMRTATKCPYCRETLEQSKPLELVCPSCGLRHPPGYRSCSSCGTPLY